MSNYRVRKEDVRDRGVGDVREVVGGVQDLAPLFYPIVVLL